MSMATPAKGKSRVLAALDNSALLGDLYGPLPLPQSVPLPAMYATPGRDEAMLDDLNPLKRKSPPEDGSGESERFKRLALGPDHPGIPAPEPERDLATLMGSSQRIDPRSSGFNLNYDSEAPIQRIDIGGPDQYEHMSEFVNNAISNFGENRSVKDAMADLGLNTEHDVLPGVEVRLLPHQIIGVSWMLQQERSRYKGGIMADEMGLGKTVQMIATMAVNQPGEDVEHKSILIVVPSALLAQWKEEIETKTNDLFSVHIHHGRDKLKTPRAIEKYDVILTTYQTLNIDAFIPKDVDEDEEVRWLMNNGGPLSRTKWWRIVLDEAQFIRNRRTRASQAVAQLRSQYRWMLTGTPVTNTLADIYGFLRFGHFRPWNNWGDFNEYIAKVQDQDAVLAGMRAQEVLKPVLLRRTKNAQLEGKPLLQLPPKDIQLLTLEFSDEERELYDCFERRTRIRVNRFIRRGTLLKNHAAVLVMILRLRQLCCHPNLILSQAQCYDDPTMMVGSEGDKELARARQVMGTSWADQQKKRFLARRISQETYDFDDEADDPTPTCLVCGDFFINDSGCVLPCTHEICFDCILAIREAPIEHDGDFKVGTDRENEQAEKEFEEANRKGWRPCPRCKKMTDMHQNIFRAIAFEPTEEEVSDAIREQRHVRRQAKREGKRIKRDESPVEADEKETNPYAFKKDLDDSDDEMPDLKDILAGKRSPGKKERRAKAEPDESADEDDQITEITMQDVSGERQADKQQDLDKEPDAPSAQVMRTWQRGDERVVPSTKMLKLMKLLKEWEHAGDKTIVYSQWTSMLDLVENLFCRHGIRNLRYDGKMTRPQRDGVLATFKRPGGPKVILISTRCGGVGLNLVSANRIVNLDLSWNFATESQAYDRVHRLGQEKSTYVKRLVVSNTLEERMLQLQDVKTGLAEAALGEGAGTKLHKLSVREIKLLFGMQPAPAVAPNANDGQRQDAPQLPNPNNGGDD